MISIMNNQSWKPLLAAMFLVVLTLPAQAQQAAVIHPDKSGVTMLTLATAMKSTAGWGTPADDASIEGNPLKIGTVAFPHGIGTHAPGELGYQLDGAFRWLSFFAGIDAENTAGTVTVQVWLDGKQIFETPILRAGQQPLFVRVPLSGAKDLKITFTDAGDGSSGDHLDLTQVLLTTQEAPPMPVLPMPETITPVADTAPLMPRHGTVSIQPAHQWEDALAAGNGIMGALLYGDPRHDTVIADHCKLWLPAGSREILPDMGAVLPEMRKVIGEQGYDAGQKFFLATARKQGWGGNLVWTDAFHPGFFLNIDQPEDGPITRYARVENFATGEVWTQWHTHAGGFSRRMFVSKPDNVVVVTTVGPPGKVSCRLTMQHVANDLIQSVVTHAPGMISCHNVYVKGKGGYDGAVRVVNSGGTQTGDGQSVSVAGADSVTLILRIQPWKTPLTTNSQAWSYSPDNPDFARADQTAGLYRAAKEYHPHWMDDLQQSVSALPAQYDALLKPHTAAWGKLFSRVSIDLGGSPKERGMSSEALLDKAQQEQRLSPALLERMYDAGRYVFLCSAGPQTPPNLFGIWTGTWHPAWSGDYTTDTNLQLDVECAYSANLAECMSGYFNLWDSYIPDFQKNAQDLYGCRGILAGSRASNIGLALHWDGGWPGNLWTPGAPWIAHWYYDYYQYTGDKAFLRDRAIPYMEQCALFYEDFLKGTEDAGGHYTFRPSFSAENGWGDNASQDIENQP